MNANNAQSERSFQEIESIFNKRIELTSSTHQEEILLVKELLTRSFYYIDLIHQKLAETSIATDKKINIQQALPNLYFQRNVHYLYGMFELCTRGLTNQAIALARVVFETILETYACLLDAECADLIFKRETDTLSEEDIKKLKKLDYLGPKIIRNRLFTDEKRKNTEKFYKQLSKISHPGIEGLSSEVDFNANDTQDKLRAILTLGTSNIIVVSEAYYSAIPQDEMKKTDILLNRVFKSLQFIPTLVPDKPDLLTKLKIKLV